MMNHRLFPNLHCAFLGDRTIILDVGRDAYRLLGPPVARVLQGIDEGVATSAVLDRLHALGIIEPGSGGVTVPLVEPVKSSAIEIASRPRAAIGFPAVASALLRSIAVLRLRGLAFSLRQMVRTAGLTPNPSDEVIAIAQAFDRHRSRIPLHQICLPDSIALKGMLRDRQLDASLVIGVRLNPFAAHCWLQSGDMVLNDSCDHVSSFTPILVQ